jgi:hypothetical protein
LPSLVTGKQTVQQGMRALEMQHRGAYPAPTIARVNGRRPQSSSRPKNRNGQQGHFGRKKKEKNRDGEISTVQLKCTNDVLYISEVMIKVEI